MGNCGAFKTKRKTSSFNVFQRIENSVAVKHSHVHYFVWKQMEGSYFGKMEMKLDGTKRMWQPLQEK